MWTQSYQQLVNRNLGLVSESEQEKLRNSCVAVCGLGGLGGIIAEILARTGVENFRLLDHGTFEPTNMNRQIFSFTDTEGRYKTDVTKDYLQRINPAICTENFLQVTPDNTAELLNGVDAVALSVDDIEAIVTLSRAARERNISLVEGWALAYGNVRVFTPDTPSLEEVYNLPTIGQDITSFSKEEQKELLLHSLLSMKNIDGLEDYYPDEATARLQKKGEGTTLAPMVWLTSVLMADEIFKILTGWGKLALAPDFAVYDSIEHRIPGKSK